VANGTSGLNAQVVSGHLNLENYRERLRRVPADGIAHPEPAGPALLHKAGLVDISRLKNALWVAVFGHADHGSTQKFGRGDVLREQPS